MPRIPGLITGDEPLPDDADPQLQPGLLTVPPPGPLPETPEQAAAAIRNRLQMLDWNRIMAPESGYAGRFEPIRGGPAYMGDQIPIPTMTPEEFRYWQDYATDLQRQNPPQDPGSMPRIAAEAQRVAPMPPATGPGGATYPLYQSPYDLYQALQMTKQNFDAFATRRAQEAVGNPR